ncbi:YARHG domain-containing protein [Ferruginibacter sp. SUN002]|uniref:YARHG domain-containing protein n=1 Tax=Ferruginibacter sp. SUN002 TaxID=2937789 RepID=UPI003D364CC7
MKLTNLFALAILGILAACGNEPKPPGDSSLNPSTQDAALTGTSPGILGSFVGDFGTNKITLLITKVLKDTIEGRSVVGGNDRPFIGLVTKKDSVYNIDAREPGDDKNDGAFKILYKESNKDVVVGNWVPYKETPQLKAKQFSLSRKSFVYSKDVGIYPQASQRLLKDDDVNNLTKWELEVMRNEIFARHGYCFKKKNLRETFEDRDWYVPHTTDVKNLLSDTEIKNVTLIKKYEKYAEDYGDEFGR